VIVRCLCCHRIERRANGIVAVEQEGGARRPIDPAREARDVVRRSLAGELGSIMGACPACGQPLVADERTAERQPYTLPAEEPPGARRGPLLGVFQGALLAAMIVPFLVWVLAIVVVVAFLSRADTLF